MAHGQSCGLHGASRTELAQVMAGKNFTTMMEKQAGMLLQEWSKMLR